MATSDQRTSANYFAMIAGFGERLIDQGDETDGQNVLDAVDLFDEVTEETARGLSVEIYELGHTDELKKYVGH